MRRRTKAAVIGAFSSIYLLLGFLFWTAGSSTGNERALELFKEKKYHYAQIYVEELEKSSNDPQHSLFQGYIFRAKEDFLSSDIRLQQSLRHMSQKKPSKKLLLEVYLNQALNAYLTDDAEKLAASIKNAEGLKEPDQGWIRVFTSIYDMKKNNKREDLYPHEIRTLKYLSPWMEEAFAMQFDDNWFALHQVRWLIDEGKFIVARQKLEDLLTNSEGAQENIHFLLGLTYSKEAERKPLDAAAPYYKLAFSYFDKLEGKKYQKEWQALAVNMQKQVHEQGNRENFPFYFGLMQKLSPWIDVHAFISDLAMMVVEQGDQEQTLGLIGLIARSPFKQATKEYMETAAQVSLRNKDYEKVEYYSQVVKALGHEKEENVLGQVVEEEILRIAHYDNPSLDQTIPLMSLWMKLESDEKRRFIFAAQIVRESERIWSGDHDKAINLMRLAKQASSQKDKISVHQMIETAVGDIYRSAVNCDQVSQYFCVMDAVRALNLIDVDVFNCEETMHQLGDAEYYFEKRRFQEANERALWVLQVDPQNQIANRIAGLIAHTEGQFDKAVLYLSKLKKLDPLAQQALDVSLPVPD